MVAYNFRRLKGTRVLFVLLWNLLVFSYHQSALGSLVNTITYSNESDSSDRWQPWQLALVSALLANVFPKLLYPFAGWLADSKLGRYKVMRYSMWMTWIGSVLLILTSLVSYSLLMVPGVENSQIPTYTLPIHVVVYIINAVGIAGYHVNVIPFGIDQMEGPSGEQIASFIHWYYWTRNFNFGVIVQFILRYIWSYCDGIDEHKQRIELTILIIQMVFLSATVSLDFLFSSKLFKDAKIHNPVEKVRSISTFIFKHGQPVGRRKAYTYTYDTPPLRSDFAKESYGGPYKDDDVEEVVSFWRMVLFLLPARFGVFLIQMGVYTYPSFFEHMTDSNPLSKCATEYLYTDSISIAAFTICIPVYEFFIYPFFRNHIPRTTVRIGLGLIVSLFGMSVLLAMDVAGHSNELAPAGGSCMFYANTKRISFESTYILPVIVIMAFGEMLAIVSTLEFIVAQSPYGMRGLMFGINFLLNGVFTGFGASLLLGFSLGFKHAYTYVVQPSCGTAFIGTVLAIGCVGSLLYFVSARWYKDRQRGGQVDINYQTILEGYYER